MDSPLRTKLLVALVGAVLLCGALTFLAGGYLINRMVIGEAQRRVDLALKTAYAMLERRRVEALQVSRAMASGAEAVRVAMAGVVNRQALEELLHESGYDFLQILDDQGRTLASARGIAGGDRTAKSTVVGRALAHTEPQAGLSLLPLHSLTGGDEALAARSRVRILPTPHARPGGEPELREVMVLEAAAPIRDVGSGRTLGVLRLGTVLNRNFDFVDFVRENIFTDATYKGKNLGTVTIFQGDVRVTTNVIGPDGTRAVGTRVSAEVYDRVLVEGKTWTGPAFVVDSWYISAYQPLRDIQGQVLGMLYVGVLKKRYDDMRNQAMSLFFAVALTALVGAIFLSFWLAARLARPLIRLTAGVTEVTRGNLSTQLPNPPHAEKDEINRLTRAFNQMVAALRERTEQLSRSRDDLQRTAGELHSWVQNYLEALEFITHELKNQIAAMKINLLAVRDGYLGAVRQEQREALDDVGLAIHRAEEMILNYLNLSRIEKGELQVRARPVHVESDVLRPVASNLKSRLENRRMQLQVEMEEDLFVQADPALLQIVYENLLGNAVKYGREGGTIRVSGRCREDGWAELHVWNDGPGVPQDQADRLFEKFFRLHQPTVQERGTGLGLFITREILLRHGGDIRVEGRFEEWIDFVFILPGPQALRRNSGLPGEPRETATPVPAEQVVVAEEEQDG